MIGKKSSAGAGGAISRVGYRSVGLIRAGCGIRGSATGAELCVRSCATVNFRINAKRRGSGFV
jgi:hypothetical protein